MIGTLGLPKLLKLFSNPFANSSKGLKQKKMEGLKQKKMEGRFIHITDNNNAGNSRPYLPRWMRRAKLGKNARKLSTVLKRAKLQGVPIPNEYFK
ncbi:hypothetical protein KAR91_76730 [Candidatus Pacearchaeota archaeon]|nr:hypothetical protein [Candidatus Pacearchaeota archaeon]